jgi:hypothetical protein
LILLHLLSFPSSGFHTSTVPHDGRRLSLHLTWNSGYQDGSDVQSPTAARLPRRRASLHAVQDRER